MDNLHRRILAEKENVEIALSNLNELKSDSLFKMVGSFKTKEGDFSERDGWR